MATAKSPGTKRSPVIFPMDLPSWKSVHRALEEIAQEVSPDIELAFDKLCKLYTAHDKHGKKPKQMTLKETPYGGLYKWLTTTCTAAERRQFAAKQLPHIATLALRMEHLKPKTALRISEQQIGETVSLSRDFVASIVAAGFLCIFPTVQTIQGRKKPSSRTTTMTSVNFEIFFSCLASSYSQQSKFLCIMEYFNRLRAQKNHLPGCITFRRIVVPEPITLGKLESSTTKLCPVDVQVQGTIESAGGSVLQVDFANEYIGGGVLGMGNVQEEIRFCLCPELLASMLFMECMARNEAIVIEGAEQFSMYSGYGDAFHFEGSYQDGCPRTRDHSLLTTITAIDAVPYAFGGGATEQYKEPHLLRDINKAYAGFVQPYITGSKRASNKKEAQNKLSKDSDNHWMYELDPSGVRSVATGNWGCGVFGGDVQLKSLLQWLVASYADCPAMIYYTFENPRVRELPEICSLIRKKCDTVGKLTAVLQVACRTLYKAYCDCLQPNTQLFMEITKLLVGGSGLEKPGQSDKKDKKMDGKHHQEPSEGRGKEM